MIGAIAGTYVYFLLRAVTPLLLLPLLAQRLGVAGMGIALTVQSLALLCAVIAEYGFHVSGTRQLRTSTSTSRSRALVSRIFGAQVFTGTVAVVATSICALMTPTLSDTPHLMIAAGLLALASGANPAWYFRGTGRAATAIGAEAAGQVGSLIAIAILVTSPADVERAVWLMCVGPAFTLFYGVSVIFSELGTPSFPSVNTVREELRRSFALFVERAGNSLFSVGSIWMLAWLTTPEQVGQYALAAKIVGLMTAVSQPIVHNVMPELIRVGGPSKAAARQLAIKATATMLALALAMVIAIHLLAGVGVSLLFGPAMTSAVPIIELLSWVCVLFVARDAIGQFVLVPRHQDSAVAAAVVVSSIFGICLSIILVPAMQAGGMVAVRLLSETVGIVLLIGLGIRRPSQKLGRQHDKRNELGDQ